MPQSGRIGRDIGTGLEPGELPGPARERHHAGPGPKIEHDVAGRGVAVPGVEEAELQRRAARVSFASSAAKARILTEIEAWVAISGHQADS